MDPDLRIVIIVAVSQNGVIGNQGEIPWQQAADLARFANLTLGHTVLAGRITHEAILKRLGHPLPVRRTLVLTRRKNYPVPAGCEVVGSLPEAISRTTGEELYVIGGAQVYSLAYPWCDIIYLTRIEASVPGDTFFPDLDREVWWTVLTESHSSSRRNQYPYTFTVMNRRLIR